ncbi:MULTISPECIES: PspC domain-containing protein [unclassified Virgibacillus]|uniref:PspC domain-containing protein n=1 Tax=unclassified Virgibacillus TaxID=2620237 RepID=UPI0024DE6573|nr:PspC domain-containing protein [Virgibacillus sp. LDC-1]
MKKLYRSTQNRMLAGVLGGLGEYTRIDPTILRLLFIIALFFSAFTLAIIYVIAIFIIPDGGVDY